jgi:hypothetical protein
MMITLDKRSIFPTKFLEAIQLSRYFPSIDLTASSSERRHAKPREKQAHTILQGLHRQVFKSRNEIARLYDAGQIEAELRLSGELSPTCALVGICEDGLPFILDFSNPAPGSLLIAGDAGSGKRLLINSLLASACRFNQPGKIKVTRIIQESDEIQIDSDDAFQEVVSADSQSVAVLFKSFIGEIEQSKKNGADDQVHLFIISDLLALVARMDTGTLSLFQKIIKHGPRYRLWTIAGLNSCDIPVMEPKVLEAFRTHLICAIQNRKLVQELSGTRKLNTRNLEFGSQFFVPYGDQWLRSWICQPLAE